jgi:hypothetical protein
MTYEIEINSLPPEAKFPDASPSAYRDRLKRWAIARLLSHQQPVIVARFRKRSDAEGHLQFLRQQIPDGTFTILFD